MGQVGVRVVVTGRVQGVFFRESCRQEAARLGVAGAVWNRSDGAVELRAEGDEQVVGALVAWCRQGPPMARVERVEVAEAPPTGALGFRVLASSPRR